VKESEILEPMDEPIEDLDQANASISILLVVITFVVFVVLMVVILAIINQILRTFSSMERNVDALLANVGCPEKNLADGMVDVAHVHIAELQNMSSNMNTVITNLRNVRQQQADTTSNPAYEQSTFFNDLVPFAQIEMTSMPVAYVVPTPSAPPPN
jgi:predicted PurR-regulated permease PerM